jgi:hypothetical protein
MSVTKKGSSMEKVLWINSTTGTLGLKPNDGLKTVNEYLENGWKVKFISAAALGDSMISGQAYIVIEKAD